TMTMAMGTIYLMSKNHVAKIRFAMLDPCFISRHNVWRGILKPTKIAIRKAPIGINIFDTRKSAASNIDNEKIVTSPKIPNDKADGIPTKKISIPVTQVVFFRFV